MYQCPGPTRPINSAPGGWPDWPHCPPPSPRGTRAILWRAPLSTVHSALVLRPAPSGPSGLRVTVLSCSIQGGATPSPIIP